MGGMVGAADWTSNWDCDLLPVEADTFSEMHRLKSDEVFHFYMGDAVEMLRLYPGGRGERVVIGTDLAAGQRPQVVVEKNIWQGSRLVRGGSWALMGCSVSPGFEFEDYEAGCGRSCWLGGLGGGSWCVGLRGEGFWLGCCVLVGKQRQKQMQIFRYRQAQEKDDN